LNDLGWSGDQFLTDLWNDTERWANRVGLHPPAAATSDNPQLVSP
jgi:hypothetical protein